MTNYAIFAADSEINYYDDAPEELFCSSCGSFIGSKSYWPSDLKITGLKKDFSYSYDGQLIISSKGKTFLEENSTTELRFQKVNSIPEAFVVEASIEVMFDTDRRKTRFIDHCTECGNFESIVGSTPPFLKTSINIEQMGVYSTDIKFGSGKEKSPLMIVGGKMGRKLKKEFKEIDLEEVRA